LDIHGAMLARAGYNSSMADTPPGVEDQREGSHASSAVVGSLEAPSSAALQSFLHDGLHFTGEGYRLLYGELMTLIEDAFPDQMPTRLPFILPAWDDATAWGGGAENSSIS